MSTSFVRTLVQKKLKHLQSSLRGRRVEARPHLAAIAEGDRWIENDLISSPDSAVHLEMKVRVISTGSQRAYCRYRALRLRVTRSRSTLFLLIFSFAVYVRDTGVIPGRNSIITQRAARTRALP